MIPKLFFVVVVVVVVGWMNVLIKFVSSIDFTKGRNLLWNVIDEPGFFSESDKGKIQSRFVKVNKKPTLLNVFQYFSLRNIPFFVNECIVNWGTSLLYCHHHLRITSP
jgi:hypothetical protein